MKRSLLFASILICASAFAHLNHIQFAAVDEIDGHMRIRYRMSADMFMSNLDADIKSGRLSESIKQKPIDQIIRAYFQTHLLLEIDGAKHEAASATFSFDSKTSDWIADFFFDTPNASATATLFCDAFLQNNPRTQTLARINWRGENTMYHLRLGNTRYVLGSSLRPLSDTQVAIAPLHQQFLDGLAQALKAYDFLAAGALVVAVLGQILTKAPRAIVPLLALAAAAALSADQCARNGIPNTIGFALGWLAVVLTVYRISTQSRRSA